MAAWSRSKTHEHHGTSFTSPREAMDDAIKRIVVADLRQRGFRGSLPHLRRRDSDCISLVSFQHFSGGGSFVVEVAVCPPGGYTTSWGDEIAPSKVRAVDINNPRPRLGNPNFP